MNLKQLSDSEIEKKFLHFNIFVSKDVEHKKCVTVYFKLKKPDQTYQQVFNLYVYSITDNCGSIYCHGINTIVSQLYNSYLNPEYEQEYTKTQPTYMEFLKILNLEENFEFLLDLIFEYVIRVSDCYFKSKNLLFYTYAVDNSISKDPEEKINKRNNRLIAYLEEKSNLTNGGFSYLKSVGPNINTRRKQIILSFDKKSPQTNYKDYKISSLIPENLVLNSYVTYKKTTNYKEKSLFKVVKIENNFITIELISQYKFGTLKKIIVLDKFDDYKILSEQEGFILLSEIENINDDIEKIIRFYLTGGEITFKLRDYDILTDVKYHIMSKLSWRVSNLNFLKENSIVINKDENIPAFYKVLRVDETTQSVVLEDIFSEKVRQLHKDRLMKANPNCY